VDTRSLHDTDVDGWATQPASARHGEAAPGGSNAVDRPETRPCLLDQIRAFDWFPSNPHTPVD
jgi:hypothetical protein